jgi:NAD(P)-dependent dehydrogenase (short-subunit alcohol dehydrogenase family)
VSEDIASMPELLLIGGTSSLSDHIIDLAERDGYFVHATYRKRRESHSKAFVNWKYLEISDLNSIENFLQSLEAKKFRRIIFLVGSTSPKNSQNISFPELSQFLQTYLVNIIYILKNLINNLETECKSNLIFLSSRSGLYGSFDWAYGVSKAGVQNFLESISKNCPEKVSLLSLAPGLIQDSKMALNMDPKIFRNHQNSARIVGGELLKVAEISKIIWDLSPEQSQVFNGKVIEVGPVY